LHDSNFTVERDFFQYRGRPQIGRGIDGSETRARENRFGSRAWS